MRARQKGGKTMELKPLTLKVRKDIWLAWKIQAATEETTMSELAERLVSEYVSKSQPQVGKRGSK
jgi:hypothetical protein